MSTKMTVIGAGHKIGAVTLPVLLGVLALGYRHPDAVRFGSAPIPVLVGAGLGLIVIGLSINFTAAFMMLRAFKSNRLLTTGPFAASRNPMYASFIALTGPGIAFALNNWLILPVSIVLYTAVLVFVKDEERWLAGRFGEQWADYTRRVGRIFPRLW